VPDWKGRVIVFLGPISKIQAKSKSVSKIQILVMKRFGIMFAFRLHLASNPFLFTRIGLSYRAPNVTLDTLQALWKKRGVIRPVSHTYVLALKISWACQRVYHEKDCREIYTHTYTRKLPPASKIEKIQEKPSISPSVKDNPPRQADNPPRQETSALHRLVG